MPPPLSYTLSPETNFNRGVHADFTALISSVSHFCTLAANLVLSPLKWKDDGGEM